MLSCYRLQSGFFPVHTSQSEHLRTNASSMVFPFLSDRNSLCYQHHNIWDIHGMWYAQEKTSNFVQRSSWNSKYVVRRAASRIRVKLNPLNIGDCCDKVYPVIFIIY